MDNQRPSSATTPSNPRNTARTEGEAPDSEGMPDEDISKGTQGDLKSRVDTSVPRPDALDKLSEQEKRALELQGEVEHAMGERREEITERAAEEVRPSQEK